MFVNGVYRVRVKFKYLGYHLLCFFKISIKVKLSVFEKSFKLLQGALLVSNSETASLLGVFEPFGNCQKLFRKTV